MHRRAFLKSIGMALPAVAIANQLPAAAGYQPVQTSEADWQPVADALGRTGTLNGGTVYRVGFPRRDLTVISYGIHVAAGLSLGGYAAFARYGDGQTMAMGDLVLLESEVPPVMAKLESMGVELTALHNHLQHESPAVMYLHIQAQGDPVKIAGAVRAALTLTQTPSAPPPAPGGAGPGLDTTRLAAALGYAGKVTGGVYQVSVPRAEPVRMAGVEIPPAMGVATALNFQPTDRGKAAITGDFVLTADEVNPVIKALRAGGIAVTALHSHMLGEEPRLYLMHFWANDDAVGLARTLHQALGHTKVRAPGV